MPDRGASAGIPEPARRGGRNIATVHLSIGGITLAVTAGDARLLNVLEGPRARFAVSPSTPDVRLHVTSVPECPRSGGRLVFDSGAVWRLFETERGFAIELLTPALGSGPYATATFNRDFTDGTIAVRGDVTDGPIDPIEYPLDQVLFSTLLARGRGVELHACGLIDDAGRGLLFVGESGAGKTTTAQLWGGRARVVSDDRVIVRKIDGDFRMYGTPWHGEGRQSSPEWARLSAVYLLRQAAETRLVGVDPAQTIARLFACTFALFHDRDAMSFTIGFLEDLARNVPVRELRFLPDESAVDAVRNERS